MLTLGTLTLPHGVFLGPMAGYTDYAMRTICREMGAEYLTGEMVSAKALCYLDRKTALLARVTASELPCAVQIFGHEPSVLAEAAARIAAGIDGGCPPSAIDINMGCPAPKIVANGDGSALMRNPSLAAQIVSAVKAAVSIPVTVKMRIGWDAHTINAVPFAQAVEAAGADMICVHGRTRTQGYSGDADYATIATVKAAVTVPVIGNGDVKDVSSALKLFTQTGCDGIMIGRGAIGNPFLFREIVAALDGHICPPPTQEERLHAALRHLHLAVENKGETRAILECRKLLASYINGTRGGAVARAALNSAITVAEVTNILTSVFSPDSF